MSAIIDLAGIALNAFMLGIDCNALAQRSAGRNNQCADGGHRQSNAALLCGICIHGFCLAGSFVLALLRLS